MARSLGTRLREMMPPWLQRRVGGAVVGGIGDVIDDFAARAAAGVKLRFPVDGGDASALALIGRERRIRRGPAEPASSYARRLRTWWDAHRTRGGPYALLEQLYLYLFDFCNVPVELVYNTAAGSGAALEARRFSMDVDGVIVRDRITWNGDGSGKWARFWVFIHAPASITLDTFRLITDDGDPLVTDDGDPIVGDDTIAIDALTAEQQAIFTLIPREWSAAHVDRIYVVLMYGDFWLVGYPPWLVGDSDHVLGGSPVVLTITE